MKPFAQRLATELTLYDAVDQLFGTRIGETLNELLIKGLMDFFDEGQSIWRMPGRRQGLFRGWSRIARRNRRLRLRGLDVGALLAEADDPEAMIDHVMTRPRRAGILWMDYFTLELAQLHGWAGFVRWRSQARHYYWQQRNPADLVDFLAIRLVLALALLEDAGASQARLPLSVADAYAEQHPRECVLRRQLNAGTVLPDYAHRIEVTLDGGDPAQHRRLASRIRAREDHPRGRHPRPTPARGGERPASRARPCWRGPTTPCSVHRRGLRFKAQEEFTWTQALERTYSRRLLEQIEGCAAGPRLDRP
jgi:hypothetical protein